MIVCGFGMKGITWHPGRNVLCPYNPGKSFFHPFGQFRFGIDPPRKDQLSFRPGNKKPGYLEHVVKTVGFRLDKKVIQEADFFVLKNGDGQIMLPFIDPDAQCVFPVGYGLECGKRLGEKLAIGIQIAKQIADQIGK